MLIRSAWALTLARKRNARSVIARHAVDVLVENNTMGAIDVPDMNDEPSYDSCEVSINSP